MIDKDLEHFIHGGVSTILASRDAALAPHMTRACGVRVIDETHVCVLLPHATSAAVFADLAVHADVALSVSSPASFHAIQLKGRCVGITEPTPEDLANAEQQFLEFSENVSRFTNRRVQARNLWLFESRAVVIEVTAIFSGVPGPNVGE
jgi:hypothetical protein